MLSGRSNEERDGWGRGEVHTGFWCANLREGVNLEDQGIDARIILQYILRKSVGRA
jgi:hypothetical protein